MPELRRLRPDRQEFENPQLRIHVIMNEATPTARAFRGVIPMLVCHDPTAEIDFCKTAFDADELSRRSGPDGSVVHATLKIVDAIIMIHDESPHLASRAPQSDGSSSVVIYLYVGDADATIERAVAGGARVLLSAANQFWGDRVGRIIDPAGHVWNVATRIEELAARRG
jgi:PhnB protein